ncbi:MAG: hypothetical protein KBT20_06125 [Bacteroidales bacterium]|nr:hypothetical protein [Candidatus Liminaster caballi]
MSIIGTIILTSPVWGRVAAHEINKWFNERAEEKERRKIQKEREARQKAIPRHKIAVLGNQGAGKTSLLLAMGAKVKDTTTSGTSQIESYDSFKIWVKDEAHIIEKGYDIGGGEEFLNTTVNGNTRLHNIVVSCDKIIYLIDINNIPKNGYNQTWDDDLGRLRMLMHEVEHHGGNKKIQVFASHAKDIESQEGTMNDYISLMKEHTNDLYIKELFDNIIAIDTSVRGDIKKIKNIVFA